MPSKNPEPDLVPYYRPGTTEPEMVPRGSVAPDPNLPSQAPLGGVAEEVEPEAEPKAEPKAEKPAAAPKRGAKKAAAKK